MKPSPPPFLEIRGLHKRFGNHVVLNAATLCVSRGSVVSILGPSGTGKSVFLKCLAGLLTPDSGEIYFEGVPLTTESKARREFYRRSRYLFQGNALFDSLTALENVALPLEQTTAMTSEEISNLARDALQHLGLGTFEQHYPAQMSGGMQKRLALARALVTKPEVMLFDEPTAGLDPLSRNTVFEMIARLRKEFNFTAIVVTHDILEALAVSDSVALLKNGRMQFQGTAAEFDASDDAAVMEIRNSTMALHLRLEELSQRASEPDLSK